jgi:MOSC domain-containing protein YiiM
MSEIYSIVYQPSDPDYVELTNEYHRVPLTSARLIANHGLDGDAKAGHHPNRQLNLLAYEWLQEVEAQGYRTLPGNFGEQLILKGVPVQSLKAGDRLYLGNEAVIEITKPRTGCERLEAVQSMPIKNVLPAVGMLARVITGGEIRVGDPVSLEPVRSVEA